MTILCLCGEEHEWKLIPAYADAFRRRGIQFFCVDAAIPFDASLDDVLRTCPDKPSAIFHFESAHPLFPIGLERSEIPTFCFHSDTYAFTSRRIKWSSVFDQVAVFHPGYVERFAAAGHPGAFLLRWAGQTRGELYKTRAKWLPTLAAEFRTNDWTRTSTLEEVANIYRRSRIVVNIGRDDFPQDANLRVFEVLASGALLITSLPSELTALGFQEGVHFVGYRNPEEMLPSVRKYLNDETARAAIAGTARALALAEHTYDQRVEQLLQRLKQAGQQELAPARSWPESRARLAALDFFAASGLVACAATQFRQIAGRGFPETLRGLSLLSRAWLKSVLAR